MRRKVGERRKTRERRQKEARVIGRGRRRRRGFHGDGEHLPSFLVPRSCRPAAGHRLAAAADVSPGPERDRGRGKKRHGRAAKDEDNELPMRAAEVGQVSRGADIGSLKEDTSWIQGSRCSDREDHCPSLSLRSSAFCSPLAPLKLTLPPPRPPRRRPPLNKPTAIVN